MCGIVGVLASEGHVDPDVLQRMNDALAHRGPDGEGFMFGCGNWEGLKLAFHRRSDDRRCDSPVRIGLGHRRLAILDLSDRGLQPMHTRDGRMWIVFNGEIYNHREIRSVLESKGYLFSTTTDTEVLLNAYAEWGEDCVARLNGMFAFAVWDDVRRHLFCARDRLGIKPFYYSTPKGYFLFASEIKALLVMPQCTRAADDQAVIGFLVHGNCDYADRTLFQGIHALPAAHTLTVDAHGHTFVRRYWCLEAQPNSARSTSEHVEGLRELLVSTVRSHLISDVRAGSCLSGGLDSSAVVGVIRKIRREQPEAAAAVGDRLYTFTSCHEQKELDEREYALEMARWADACPHLVFPSAEDFWSDFQRIAWHQDMPFGTLSFYSQWRVMRAVREAGVKVLIDGQGGDEVFGGYAKFRYAHLVSLLRSGQLGALTHELGAMLKHDDRYLLDIRKGFRYLPAFARAALRTDSILQHVVIGNWKQAVSQENTPGVRWWRNARQTDQDSPWTFVQRVQVDDITFDTLPQLLRMEDRSSMAFSLEARVPLLDHNVVQYGVSLPDHLKVRHGYSKYAMRQAMSGLIPEKVRLRRTKLGFAAPDRSWLLNELRCRIGELLHTELRCDRYVAVPELRRWYTSPRAASANAASYRGSSGFCRWRCGCALLACRSGEAPRSRRTAGSASVTEITFSRG